METMHTNFHDGAKNISMKNVIKCTESVKESSSYKSIAIAVKKSNIEESTKRYNFHFLLTYFSTYFLLIIVTHFVILIYSNKT